MVTKQDDAVRQYGIVLLPSTSHAIRAEKVLNAAGISCRLIPVPRHLSSDCGLALCFEWSDRGKVATALRAAQVNYERILLLN
jgi:hypothetical protein